MLAIDRSRIPRIRTTRWDPSLDFNRPENVGRRIKKRQAAKTIRIQHSRDRLASAQKAHDISLANAMATQQRVSAPGYQEEIRAQKTADELMKVNEKYRGWGEVQKLRNKGLMNLQKDEQKYMTETAIRQGIIPGPNTPKTKVMSPTSRASAINKRTAWLNKAFAQPGVLQSGPLTNREVNRAWSKHLIPGSGTRAGLFSGLAGIDQLARFVGKNMYKYIDRPSHKAYNWLMSPY